MSDLLRDLVTISHRQTPGHRDAHLRMQPMPDPAGSEIGHLFHARNVTRSVTLVSQALSIHAALFRRFDFTPFSGPLRQLMYWTREA